MVGNPPWNAFKWVENDYSIMEYDGVEYPSKEVFSQIVVV